MILAVHQKGKHLALHSMDWCSCCLLGSRVCSPQGPALLHCLTAVLVQGGNKAAAGGDQIGSKKGKDADGDASIPVKAVAEGVVTPVNTTDIDSSGTPALSSRLFYVWHRNRLHTGYTRHALAMHQGYHRH